MIRPLILRRRRVLVDVDTQKDLFLSSGNACVRNHRRVLANIRRALAWGRLHKIHLVSTVAIYPAGNKHTYCCEGTDGAELLSYALRPRRTMYPADGSTDLHRDVFSKYSQVILEKRSSNPFDEPRAERLLTELRADEFIVVGGLAEEAVKSTVLGLLLRGKNVTVLVDAVGVHNRNKAEVAFRQMSAKGAKLIETKTLAGTSCLRRVGACPCDSCAGKKIKALSVSA